MLPYFITKIITKIYPAHIYNNRLYLCIKKNSMSITEEQDKILAPKLWIL